MTETPEVWVVHHHDIEKRAEHFNEGFDEAHRQGVGGEASRNWVTEKVVPLLKDHVDPENLYHLADHIADALLSEADLDHTYTESDMRVLTEAALRLGRKEAGEEAYAHLMSEMADPEVGVHPQRVAGWRAAAERIRELASQLPQDATSGRTDPKEGE